MANPWFRMYVTFMTDPDVEELSFEDQRHFVFLLCMKCAGLLDKDFDDPDKRERAIGRRLGLQGEAFTFAKQRLMESRLIDGQWQPRSWQKLQFKSDHDAAERQRRSRANRSVTSESRDSHTLEQNRTDTEQIQSRAEEPRASRATRLPDDFSLTDERRTIATTEGLDAERTYAKFCDFWTAASGQRARKHDWDAAWRYWCRNDRGGGTTRTAPRKTRYEEMQEALRNATET